MKSSAIESTTWPAILSSAGLISTFWSSTGKSGSRISSGHSNVCTIITSRLPKSLTRNAASLVLLRSVKCTIAIRSVSASVLASSTYDFDDFESGSKK
ncbi:Uncharacterised protein [Mycobacterium tuberculosis]|nr:Uncharacterised protein [Mycobacterium tuberculosis]COW76583.1 Uncharacterised protein [Mycobacterium tuberculosis]